MRKLAKFIITRYLFIITRLTLAIHQPTIIAIAGRSNKTLVKQIAVKNFSREHSVRTNPRQWNSEIGIPLSILFLKVKQHTIGGWLKILAAALISPVQRFFPTHLILELGFNHPGDIRYLSKLLSPQLAIITNVKPMYLESFNDDLKELIREYQYLIDATQKNKTGKIIINADIPPSLFPCWPKEDKIIRYSLQDKNKQGWWVDLINETDEKQTFLIYYNNKEIKCVSSHLPGEGTREAHLITEILIAELNQ